jgi:hypothetical protein
VVFVEDDYTSTKTLFRSRLPHWLEVFNIVAFFFNNVTKVKGREKKGR